MFKNPGEKIKGWAKVIFILFLILEAVSLMAAYQQVKNTSEYVYYGATYSTAILILLIIAFVLLTFLNYIFCLMIYGYGELVGNSTIISNNIDEQKQSVDSIRGDIRAIYLRLRTNGNSGESSTQ